MKLISKLAVTSAVIALAFVSTANAQSMRVEVPFGFKAGNLSLPAGAYRVDLNRSAQRISLSQLDGHASCFLNVKSFNGNRTASQGSLVFNQYGNEYFLSRVKASGVEGAAELFTSRAELQVAKAPPNTKGTLTLSAGR